MSNFNVPGAAVAVVQGGEIVYAEGFGQRNVQTGEPVTTETVFRVGSTTKSMTAMLVATQVDEGLFGWDTPVVDLVPGFSLPNER
jgi:CubicO group peptidase (beta-lactamase class C family)